ncbi:MAG: hypothetical protein ACJATS_001482, partial [Psychroserpens sp.]
AGEPTKLASGVQDCAIAPTEKNAADAISRSFFML